MQETLFWLSGSGIPDDVARTREEHAAARTLDEDDIRAELGVPRRADRRAESGDHGAYRVELAYGDPASAPGDPAGR